MVCTLTTYVHHLLNSPRAVWPCCAFILVTGRSPHRRRPRLLVLLQHTPVIHGHGCRRCWRLHGGEKARSVRGKMECVLFCPEQVDRHRLFDQQRHSLLPSDLGRRRLLVDGCISTTTISDTTQALSHCRRRRSRHRELHCSGVVCTRSNTSLTKRVASQFRTW